jgi:hypothetical protein
MWGMCGTEGLYTHAWEASGSSISRSSRYFDEAFYGFPQLFQTGPVVTASMRVQMLSDPSNFFTIPAVVALYFQF